MVRGNSDDPVIKAYAKDLATVTILDAKTERETFLHYKKTGSIESRNKLVLSGVRFVIKIAERYARDSDHHKELIAAGNEGLITAVDRYDLKHKTRFLSYATWWVVLAIRENLHKNSSVVQVPMWRKKALRKIRAARDQVYEQHGRMATQKEIKAKTGLSLQQQEGLAQETFDMVPLDADTAQELSTEENVEDSVSNALSNKLVQYLISQLPVREAFVLRAYFGFLSSPPLSLKQVAQILTISSERVRQIKFEALLTLKNYLDALGLKAYDDVF